MKISFTKPRMMCKSEDDVQDQILCARPKMECKVENLKKRRVGYDFVVISHSFVVFWFKLVRKLNKVGIL